MRNSRSSLPRLASLAVPLWALSACFGAPEPPVEFAPSEDAVASTESDAEDTTAVETGDTTSPDGGTTAGPSDVEAPSDATETVVDTTETVADTTEPDAASDATADPADVASAPTCPAVGGLPQPANTCVDWLCSDDTTWTSKTVPSREGETCESPCYPGAGELTCQSGECRPAFGGAEACEDATPGDLCTTTVCDHVLGSCSIQAQVLCEDDEYDCTSQVACNPESGACEPTIDEDFCLLAPLGEDGPKACYEANTKAPGNTCMTCSVTDSQTSWSTIGSGIACDDGNPCTEESTCNELSDVMSVCAPGPPLSQGAACDDSDLTTANDQCDGAGACAGTPLNCPETECTVINPDGVSCNETPVAMGTSCANDLPCITGKCDGAGECTPEGGILEGWCQLDGVCVPDGQTLPDNACQRCEVSTSQTSGVETTCDDDDACTQDSCDPATGECSHVLLTTDAADPCDGIDNNCDGLTDEDWTQEYCGPAVPGGSCTKVGDPNPNAACQTCTLAGEVASFTTDQDDTPCTATCIPDGLCAAGQCKGAQDTSDINCSCCVSHYPASPGCSDPEAEQAICNGAGGDPWCCSTEGNWDDECAQKATQLNYCGPTICADGVCNIQEALAGTGDNSCEDLDCSGDIQCTTNDQCDDGNPCTVDVCNDIHFGFDTKCTHLPAEVVGQTPQGCDDGDICNGESDQCVMGVCLGDGDDGYEGEGESLECDDDTPCTDDVCEPDQGCVYTPDDGACDDGVSCTVDTCDEKDGCLYAPAHDQCDDGVSCTVDTCDEKDGCLYTPDDDQCDDGVSCTINTCDAEAGCEYEADDTLCDDDSQCTDDSCDLSQGCQYEANESCLGLECTTVSDCDFANCQGSCESDYTCSYAPDSYCHPSCVHSPESEVAAYSVELQSVFGSPTGGMAVKDGVALIGVESDFVMTGGHFEILRYNLTGSIALPSEAWTSSMLGASSGAMGVNGKQKVRTIHGRDGWVDIGLGIDDMCGEMNTVGAVLCSVELDGSVQNTSPDSDDCPRFQDDKADGVNALAHVPGFVIAGVGTQSSYLMYFEDNEPELFGERNYIVSLKLDNEGNVTETEGHRLDSHQLIHDLGIGQVDPQFLSITDIAVDEPTNGGATRVIVTARIRGFEDPDGSYWMHHNDGGVVFFATIDSDGKFTVTPNGMIDAWEVDSQVMTSTDNTPTHTNELWLYEATQVLVNRRADRSIAYVLWSPDSIWGLSCDPSGDGFESFDCESVVTAHDITDSTPQFLAASPVYSVGGTVNTGQGKMAMTLIGSPVGKTRLAIGDGGLYAVEHTYDTSMIVASEVFSDVPKVIVPSPMATMGLDLYGAHLLWLAEDNGAPYKTRLLGHELSCE